MLDTALKWFFEWFLNAFSGIINFLTAPLIGFLNQVIPNFNTILSTAQNFITNYFFKGLQFAKMVVVNFFQINQVIFTALLICVYIGFGIFFLTRAFRLAQNIWALFRKGNTSKGG